MNLVRRLSRAATVLGVLILLAACGPREGATGRLAILHSNDIHGQYAPSERVIDGDTVLVGGFEAMSHWVRELTDDPDGFLLVDAGDLMTGNLICDLEYEGALGGGLIAMMNAIGYDCLVPGNHMFDHSLSNMRELEKIAEFPFVCGNLNRGDESATRQAFVVLERAGLRIGIIGVTYHPMRGMVADPNLEGFESEAPTEIVRRLAAELDSKTDLLLVLSHAGIEYDSLIAWNVPGIDLIIGGHNHLELDSLPRVNGVWLAQGGSYNRKLGWLQVDVAGDSIQGISNRLVELAADSIDPDSTVVSLVHEFDDAIKADYGQVIGRLSAPWTVTRGEENAVGQWLTDALRGRLGANVAVLNTGGIRKSLPAGDVTKRDVMEMLPFDNNLVTFTCTGEELLALARHNLGLEGEGYPIALQVSGLACTWRQNADGTPEIVSVKVDGRALDPEGTYTVASINYIVLYNAERYFGFAVDSSEVLADKLSASIVEEIRNAGTINPRLESRITQIK